MKYRKGEMLLAPNKSNLRGLEPAVQVLFIWLAEHGDDNAESFPSRTTLAAECGISVRTMDRAMQKLVDLGMVKKKPRYNGNEQTTNLYQVVILAPPRVKSARGGDKSALGGDKNDTQNSPHLTHPIEDIDDKSSMETEVSSDYGKGELNKLFDFWAQTTGLPIQRQVKRNRFACFSLLKAMSQDELCELIQTVVNSRSDKFAPVINDFISLEYKLAQLQAWKLRNSPAPAINVGALLHPEKYGKVAARV